VAASVRFAVEILSRGKHFPPRRKRPQTGGPERCSLMTVGRRAFLALAASAGATGICSPAASIAVFDRSVLGRPPISASLPSTDVRRAFIHNLHTGDTLDAVYWEAGRYVPGALAEAKRVMRDWRNGQEHVMDPHLFDVLHAIQLRVETNRPVQLVSGYRSPATNAMLHAESGQVAAHSQHLHGKASDIRIEGVDLRHLHRAALSVKAGGVGFYPQSDFVHVDVGPVRQWSGT
jgi:uncharacterized protein YcbK (DUF882 family)